MRNGANELGIEMRLMKFCDQEMESIEGVGPDQLAKMRKQVRRSGLSFSPE